MKNPLVWIVVAIVAVAAAWYFSTRQDMAEVQQADVLPMEKPTPEPQPPVIEHPVEDIRVAEGEDTVIRSEPLPPLEESDPVVIAELSEWVGNETLQRFVVTEQIIGRVVATVDSLTGPQVGRQLWPVRPAGGTFRVLEADGEAVISPENATRYRPYVDLALSLDTDRMVALYTRYYPLFQEAYRELGYPEGYFNDRVVGVIDDLLEAPEPGGMPAVVKSEAVWVYENPEYESASIGQKLLMRLDAGKAADVKAKLRELRDALAGVEVPVEAPAVGVEEEAIEDPGEATQGEE